MTVDVLAETDNEHDKKIMRLEKSDKIYGFIDNEHVLIRKTDNIQVYNFIKQNVKFDFYINAQSELIEFNKRVIVLWNEAETSDCIEVIAIQDKKYQFQTFKIGSPANGDTLEQPLHLKCFSVNEDPYEFELTAFYAKSKYLQITKYRVTGNATVLQVSSPLKISMEHMRLVSPKYCLTHLSKFFFFVSNGSDETSGDDDLVLAKSTDDYGRSVAKRRVLGFKNYENIEILALENENDFIVYVKNFLKFSYVKINHNNESLDVHQIGRNDDKIQEITTRGNLLSVLRKNSILIYEVVSMAAIHCIEVSEAKCLISWDLKYLIIGDNNESNKTIKVKNLNDPNKMIAISLDFQTNLTHRNALWCTDQYFLVELNNGKLVTIQLK